MSISIAIMMRAIDQPSAFQSFVEGIVEKMLQIDGEDRFILIYKTSKWYGRFESFRNAKEFLVRSPHKFIWDQMVVPWIAWREKCDVIYNPKFSIPLISHCPVTMGLHEMGWRIWPEYYEKLDVLYEKIMFPIYCKKSKHFFPWSKFQLDEISGYLRRELNNSTITPPAPAKNFRPISDKLVLDKIKMKYNLPQKFILGVTRVDHSGIPGSTKFFPGKNVDITVKAYLQIKNKVDYKLVIAGNRVKEYLLYRGFNESDLDSIQFLGFVSHDDLPMLFNLAELFIMPSFFEGFGLTLVEAMACGCPAVVSETGSLPEVSRGATLLADPYNPSDFAEKTLLVLENEKLRYELKKKGLQRASTFTWEISAKMTIEALREVVLNFKHKE